MTSVYPRGGIWWGKFKTWDDRWQPVSTSERIGAGPEAHRASRQRAAEYIQLLQRRENDKRHALKLGLVDPADIEVIDLGPTSIETARDKYLETIASIAHRKEAKGVLRAFQEHSRVQIASAFGSRRIISKVRDFLDDAAGDCSRQWLLKQRAHIVRFAQWLEDEGYIADNQTRKVKCVGGRTDRAIEHRALTVAEVHRLIQAEENLFTLSSGGSVIPDERRLHYRFLIWTGIRGEESVRLLRSDFDFSGDIAYVHMRKEVAKNKLECWLPLLPSLASELRSTIGMWLPTARAFRRIAMRDETRLDRLREDLHSVGIDGTNINWRSFRMTFVSNLEAAGVELGMRMKLRRDVGKGSERLTNWTYSDWKVVMPTVLAALARAEAWFAAQVANQARTQEARA